MLFLNNSNTWYLFIFLFMFLICWWITGRFVKKSGSRITISFAASLILTYVTPWIFIILFTGYMAADHYESPRSFDPIEWKSAKDRQTMVKDLIESEILIGKRTDQILNFLGDEFELKTFEAEKESWTYSAGQAGHGFGIRFLFLEINFENGIVKKIHQREIID